MNFNWAGNIQTLIAIKFSNRCIPILRFRTIFRYFYNNCYSKNLNPDDKITTNSYVVFIDQFKLVWSIGQY